MLEPKCYLCPFMSQSQYKFSLGDRPSIWGEGVELGGREWYLVKAHHGGHNLSIETETLSLSVYEPIAIQILFRGTVPQFVGGVELGGRVWYPMKVLHFRYKCLLEPKRYLFSFTSQSQCKFYLGGPSPNLGEGLS